MLQHIIPDVDYPSAFSNWLQLLLRSNTQKELAICGVNAQEYATKINNQYLPHVLLAATNTPSNLAFLKDRFPEKGVLFYVCQDKACELPTSNFENVNKDLNRSS